MTEHKKKILEMLSEGKIGVDEAEKLLTALTGGDSEVKKEEVEESRVIPKNFNILVDSADDGGEKVRIKVPLCLLRAGVKFANLIPQSSRDKIQHAMDENGIAFDLNELNSKNLDDFLATLNDFEVSVADKDNIRIFCE